MSDNFPDVPDFEFGFRNDQKNEEKGTESDTEQSLNVLPMSSSSMKEASSLDSCNEKSSHVYYDRDLLHIASECEDEINNDIIEDEINEDMDEEIKEIPPLNANDLWRIAYDCECEDEDADEATPDTYLTILQDQHEGSPAKMNQSQNFITQLKSVVERPPVENKLVTSQNPVEPHETEAAPGTSSSVIENPSEGFSSPAKSSDVEP